MKKMLPLLQKSWFETKKLKAILIDPDKFEVENALETIVEAEKLADFLLVGGSTDSFLKTEKTVEALKKQTSLPIVLFPGDYTQITPKADAILFLSLISGRNPEYLIEQQVKSVPLLKNSDLEIIPTGYILIDGGKETAVERVSQTKPMSQDNVETIVNTALAGQFSGKQLIYLEAGSGANYPVKPEIISEVKKAIDIPLFVGGGINQQQAEAAFEAGADVVVIGTAFENQFLKKAESSRAVWQ